jgi:hypothetical protein
MSKRLVVGFASNQPDDRTVVAFRSDENLQVGTELRSAKDPSQKWRVSGMSFARSSQAKHAYLLSGNTTLHDGDELVAN